VDLSAYAIDGLAPSRVERATSAADVAAVLGGAHRSRSAVVLFGGGTRIGIGSAPERYDAALDLRGLRGIVEHSAADLVCTVRAGTTLAELAAALAPAGQRWPVDAPEPERATVGGTIASAAPAASRLRRQHVRDWIIGCEAVLGDGTRVRAGGRVVKNVTGYDLTRLYSGTYGTLAAITEVSLRLVAIDERTRTVRLRGERREELETLARELLAGPPQEAIVLASGREAALYVRAAGPAVAVERAAALAGAQGGDIGEPEWRALAARVTREPFVVRVSVPPGREMEFAQGEGQAYVGTGLAFLFGERTAGELLALRARCEAAGGALVIERGTAERKLALGVWGERRASHPGVAAALKARFDPHGVLAPGRMPA
jgi:glycolate oxidase FAD binding subunit